MALDNRLSESIRKFPEETIVSPGFNPERTITFSSTLAPVLISRGSKYPSGRATKTVCRSPESSTAPCGTRSEERRVGKSVGHGCGSGCAGADATDTEKPENVTRRYAGGQ